MSKKSAIIPRKEPIFPELTLLERPWFSLTILVIGIIVSFYPVTRYFFSQDDFIFLFNSAYNGSSYFLSFFKSDPGQFRPLSKSLYFTFSYKSFGLNPAPYHYISLFIYILNALLFYRLMTRLRIPQLPAVAITAFFALSMTSLNVVAWISCIQSLLGEFFLLLSILFGIDALEKSSMKHAFFSILAYLLALMSMEQAYPVPLLLILYAYLVSPSPIQWKKFLKSQKIIIPHFIILCLYLVFMLLWKNPPQEGLYAFHFGTNIGANFLTYIDRAFSFSVLFPFISNKADSGLTVSHLFTLALVLYNIIRRRERFVIFGLFYYVLTILPTLFLQEHIYYLHLYIPSAGLYLLLALALNDFLTLLAARNRRAAGYAVPFFVLLLSLISYTKVRENQNRLITSTFPLPKNFVFRRAIIAKNTWDDIQTKTTWKSHNSNVYMFSLSNKSNWFGSNVINALGGGYALKLLFKDPELDVFFKNRGETIQGYIPPNSLILYFDDFGHCFTVEEYEKVHAPQEDKIISPE